MEGVLKELKSLSLDEIRQELHNRGENIGPAMPSMRFLFEKKLARRIMRERGIENDELDAPQEVAEFAANKLGDRRETKDSETEEISCYYAVSLPQDLKFRQDQLVFTDRKEAMKAIKILPGCRFKIFKDMADAETFSKVWAENIVASPKPQSVENVTSEGTNNRTQAIEERINYKEPARADRIILKCAVETGDIETVTNLIWSNPYYLMSVGETPVVLHEAFRYNALHLAAKYNKPCVCRVILAVVRDDRFHELLFPDDTEITRKNRKEHLLDLFLNMPDKGSGETPLHFACKFGNADVVEVLTDFSQCDTQFKNKMGETPHDVINQRADKPDVKRTDRIRKLLRGRVYIPLFRVPGSVAVVGQPISKVELNDKTLKAYAGPMTTEKGEMFYRSWVVYPPNSPQHQRINIQQTKRSDYDKGMERLGRDLASDFDVEWNEYWDFLNIFIDLRSVDGLNILENYLKGRRETVFDGANLNGNDVLESDSSKTLERYLGEIVTSEKMTLPSDTPSLGNVIKPETPDDVSLLAVEFGRLKLNDSGHENLPKNTLQNYESSDSESEYESAPSSPVHSAQNGKSNTAVCHHLEETVLGSDDDDFQDAEAFDVSHFELDHIYYNNLPCLRTPLQNSKSRDYQQCVAKTRDIFIDGWIPTKLDLDVLRAVGDVALKANVYPFFSKWRRAVTSYSAVEMNQWPSPARVRWSNKPRLASPFVRPTRNILIRSDLNSLKSKLDFDS